ncbi:hypothetical protein ACTQW9_07190 [Lachnospiraceae bacterium LCP19S3_B12]
MKLTVFGFLRLSTLSLVGGFPKGTVNANTIFSVGIDRLQSFGMTVVTPVYTYTMTDRTEALANYNKYLEI